MYITLEAPGIRGDSKSKSIMLKGVGKMQLVYLCDMELVYREESLYGDTFILVRPYGSEEGTGYGEGDGIVKGSKLSGKVRWVNHPHRRSDVVMMPDINGSLQTDDGAHI